MITRTYKEYTAQIVYSEEDGCFIGDLVGIRDIVSFTAILWKRFVPLLKNLLTIIF